MSYDLPRDYFVCPPLSPEEYAYIEALAKRTALDIVEKAQLLGGPIHWKFHSSERDMRIFRGQDAIDGGSLFVGAMEVAGTIEEIIELFRTDTPKHAARFRRRFGKGVSEAITLYSLRDTPQERVAVKWQGFKSPLSLVRPRDNCVLECMHGFSMPDGRRGWVRGWKSVKIACCPDLEDSLGFVRMLNHGSGLVFMESSTKSGAVDVLNVGHADMRVGKSEWILDKLQTRQFLTHAEYLRRCRSILHLNKYLCEDRLALTPFAVVLDPIHAAKECFNCSHPLHRWSKKTACLKCGHIMCRRCNLEWQVDDRAVLVCTACVCKVTPASPKAFTSVYHTTSPSSASSGAGWTNDLPQEWTVGSSVETTGAWIVDHPSIPSSSPR
ncbi:unnamed protein product [Aphanomyces euteiches]|nr:hypothetical protein AeRB84_019081 [Aphanomyces euteiches]